MPYNKYMEITEYEEEFLKHFKRKTLLKGYEIKTKISIIDLCNERKDLHFDFSLNRKLVEEVVIDIVIYKGNKVLAGIEIVDEPDEMNMNLGEQLFINTVFNRLEYEYFRIVDLNKLDKAADIIKEKLNKITKKR